MAVSAHHCRQIFWLPMIPVDWLTCEHNLEKIHLRRSTVQGFERQMPDGLLAGQQPGLDVPL